MSLDIRKLQNLYKSDAVSRAIIDTLNEEGASQYPEVTEFGGGFLNGTAFAHLDESKRAQEIVKALKAIQRTGCGTFITGREGDSSSMSWDLEHLRGTSASACGLADPARDASGRGAHGRAHPGGPRRPCRDGRDPQASPVAALRRSGS